MRMEHLGGRRGGGPGLTLLRAGGILWNILILFDLDLVGWLGLASTEGCQWFQRVYQRPLG
jgi:hypothetical protein